MGSPTIYIDNVGGTGRIYFRSVTNPPVNSQLFPIAGLAADGSILPILVDKEGRTVIAPGSGTIPHYEAEEATTTPGIDQSLIAGTVPADTSRALAQVLVVTRVTGSFVVNVNGVAVGSGRTGPGCLGVMPWASGLPLEPGDEYEVLFRSRPNSPPQSVECYLQANDMSSA